MAFGQRKRARVAAICVPATAGQVFFFEMGHSLSTPSRLLSLAIYLPPFTYIIVSQRRWVMSGIVDRSTSQ